MAAKDTTTTAASTDAATTTAAATEASAPASSAAGNTSTPAIVPSVIDRKAVPATDRTTMRVLRSFTSHGEKGSVVFRVGIPVSADDVAAYFPSAQAYSNRVAWGYIGIPSVSNGSGLRRGL